MELWHKQNRARVTRTHTEWGEGSEEGGGGAEGVREGINCGDWVTEHRRHRTEGWGGRGTPFLKHPIKRPEISSRMLSARRPCQPGGISGTGSPQDEGLRSAG